MLKPTRSPPKGSRGEDYLGSVKALTLTLEDGTTHDFDLDREIEIPDDPREVWRQLVKAPARFAFWAYQTERALKSVREREQLLDTQTGKIDLIFRQAYLDKWLGKGGEFTETTIKSQVATDREVIMSRKSLDAARYQHGLLRAVKEAVGQRIFILQSLVRPDTHRPE